ncbi:hypothetical protein D3C79_613660 [compost metagenome]
MKIKLYITAEHVIDLAEGKEVMASSHKYATGDVEVTVEPHEISRAHTDKATVYIKRAGFLQSESDDSPLGFDPFDPKYPSYVKLIKPEVSE